MVTDARYDRLLLWLARRIPSQTGHLHGLVNDHRLERAIARRGQVSAALRPRRRR